MIKVLGIEYIMGSEVWEPEKVASHYETTEKSFLRNVPGKVYRFSQKEEPVNRTVDVIKILLGRKNVPLSRVDGVFGTNNFTSQTIMPSYTAAVAHKLGLRSVIADHIGQGCGGIGQVFRNVFNQLRCDTLDNKTSYYLIITAEKIKRILSPGDKSGMLFSDSSVACLVTNDPNAKSAFELADVRTQAVVTHKINVLKISSPFIDGANRFEMVGREVFKFGSGICKHVLRLAGLDSIPFGTLLIPHQPNIRMLRCIAEKSGLPRGQVYIDGIKKGNTLNSSILIALKDVALRGIQDQDVWLVSFGAELQVGLIKLKASDPTLL